MTPTRPLKTLAEMAAETAQSERTAGIVCPVCGCRQWATTNTRPTRDLVLRYKKCRHCGNRIKTIER